MARQSEEAQKGEVDFREKLYRQRIGRETVFEDELGAEEMKDELLKRMEKTASEMEAIRRSGISVSPYIDIGAETGHRSLVMENELGASGAALDISFHQLRSCAHYAEAFDKPRLPLRICCDANLLPFLRATVPFVFCYQVLHHFPDPAPPVAEIYRVLAPGGHFYFTEEPYKRLLHLGIYRYRRRSAPPRSIPQRILRTLDAYLGTPLLNETGHGVTENMGIPLRRWMRSIAPFTRVQLALRSWKGVGCDLAGRHKVIDYVKCSLMGGEITGLCRKAGTVGGPAGPIAESLACPQCLADGRECRCNLQGDCAVCSGCGAAYPVVDGVLFMYTRETMQKLYPDIHTSSGGGW